MKKSSLKTLKRKLAKTFSDYCYKRDKGRCQWCRKKIRSRRGAHAHHIIAKGISNQYGRYDAQNNSVLLCFKCHFFRLKSETYEYVKFIESYLAEKDLTYEKLRAMYQTPVKLRYDDYKFLWEKLKRKNE